MLVADDDGVATLIGQPAHAWLSGQLARAWGNERLAAPAPFEEVCLAAVQHDIGMIEWDAAPTLNPETGLPHSFLEMPTSEHLPLWERAPRLVLPQSRYAALLVSLHGTGLYERRDLSRMDDDVSRAVREYLAAEREWQEELLHALRSDPAYALHAADDVVARNRALVRAWDWLSICLCLGLSPQAVAEVPQAGGGDARLELRHVEGERWTLEPWPFAEPAVELVCEGRRLEERHTDVAAMRAALAQAPWVTLRFALAR